MNKKNYWWFLIIAVVLVADLVTKALTDGIVHQEFISGLFCIESYHNTGASFSIFSDSAFAQILFIILGIIVSISIFTYSVMAKKARLNAWFFIGGALMIGGILGNVIDRIALGYVRDFISLQFMDFAVFNIADSALTCGVLCVAVWLIFFAYREKDKGKESGKKDF